MSEQEQHLKFLTENGALIEAVQRNELRISMSVIVEGGIVKMSSSVNLGCCSRAQYEAEVTVNDVSGQGFRQTVSKMCGNMAQALIEKVVQYEIDP